MNRRRSSSKRRSGGPKRSRPPARRPARRRDSEKDAQESFIANLRKFLIFLAIAGLLLLTAKSMLDRAWRKKITEQRTLPAPAVDTATGTVSRVETNAANTAESVDALLQKVHMLRDRGLHEQALLQCRRAEQLDPEHPEVQQITAYLLVDLERHREAATYLEKRVTAEPNRPELLNDLGALYLLMRRPADAAPLFLAAVDQAPDRIELRFNAAAALYQLNRLDEAAEQIAVCIEQQPGAARNWRMKALIETENGLYRDAMASLASAVDHEPDWVQAHMDRAAVAALIPDYDTALDHLRRVSELTGPASAYRYFMQRVFNGLRETEQGRQFTKEIVDEVKKAFGKKQITRHIAASERPIWSEQTKRSEGSEVLQTNTPTLKEEEE